MSNRTPIDPDDFEWGDICDMYGTPYRIGDQYRLPDLEALPGMPDLEAGLGPTTLLYFEVPPDEDTETQYVTGRPKDPHETGGWTHYKLRELTEHRGTRVPPSEVLRMIDATEKATGTEEWMDKARTLTARLSGPDDTWLDEADE